MGRYLLLTRLFLFINERLFEALFYGALALIIILLILMIINSQSQKKKKAKYKKLKYDYEHLIFDMDSNQKLIQNQDNRLSSSQKNLEEAQKKIQELSLIFSDQNVILEKEVRKQTHALRETNVQLQKVVDELDMFIYKTAHDIRGPLARLMGLSGVALLDVKDVMSREYISKLSQEANNLNNILARLSTIYEINHVVLRKETVDSDILFKKVLIDVESMEGYDLIKFNFFKEESIHISTDPYLLEFILRNLIENAIRFKKNLPQGKSYISVHFIQDGKYLILKVIDNGIGINPSEEALIFEMFSRAAGIHKTTGLGLYMTKLSVEKLGGNIELNTRNQGVTEFRVEIPL